MKRALILGIGGQDGSYLAELLLEKGYEVHGLVRRSSVDNLKRLDLIRERVTLYQGDLTDHGSILNALNRARPEELYNLADQDHVGFSLNTPGYSLAVTAGAVAELLQIVLQELTPGCKVFQPVSATMFGTALPPQNEQTPFAPQSPYACAKVAAYYLCQHYRREYGLFVSTGIMYNHDSPRRQGDYLLHKICRSAVACNRETQKELWLGDLDIILDVGYAPDYVEAAWKVLQHDKPDDFVVASGDCWSIREVARSAFLKVRLHWEDHVKVDTNNLRPGTPPCLFGDIRKIKNQLGWAPKTTLDQLIGMIIDHYQYLSR